jgi:putative spermidine/putrescine transport system permease protein
VAGGPLTYNNYAELLQPSFFDFVWETLRISFLTTTLGLAIAFPISYLIAVRLPSRQRTIAIVCLVTLMFLSALVRTYALELTFGAVSPLRPLLTAVSISPNSRTYIQFLVGAGLLQFIIPLATLTLISVHQNLDWRLVEAAQSLGAPAWRSHFSITLPLSAPGLVSAFLLSFTFAMSAFVVPMILGKGRVLFLSNLIYSRFSEIANYPSGAAISIVTLALSLIVVYGVSRLLAGWSTRAKSA